jgi:two-component system phosphate regulon sensor histidine kinase PhoR
MFTQIRWRIAVPYILLILLTMLALGVWGSDRVRRSYAQDLEAKLTAEGRLIADALAESAAWTDPESDLDRPASHYSDLLEARITLIRADGLVLGESHEDRTQMDNHLVRPEVQQALDRGQGSSIRFSRTVGYRMMYVAVPVPAGENILGVVRMALPLEEVEVALSRLRWALVSAAIVASLGAGILAVLIAAHTAGPIRQLTQVVQGVAQGDLTARLLPTTRDEVGVLTQSFNEMADRLRRTIVTLDAERKRSAAVLDNMAGGVLITDHEGRVRLINPAAARLLGTTQEEAMGRTFAQVARDHRLIGLWRACADEGQEQVEVVEMDGRSRFLQAIVTCLQQTDQRTCLVILQDLTRVRQLETVRRDFISNVSHELRTPLASLKVLVDTLREGALTEDPGAARRFLDHMEAEVDALAQMVQELLELSRIESGQAPFRLTPVEVSDVVLVPVERLAPQAQRAELVLTVDLPSGLPRVLADTERARQVVTNLVHNAIKFTPQGGQVTVSAEAQDDEVVVSVQDTGIGIPAGDLPRIFERFYKTDRARAGGGVGLGLAIARHIIQAHGGRIWVDSVEGRGSTFHFTLRSAGEVEGPSS